MLTDMYSLDVSHKAEGWGLLEQLLTAKNCRIVQNESRGGGTPLCGILMIYSSMSRQKALLRLRKLPRKAVWK